MTLEKEDLNDTDEVLLDYLGDEGRATPALLKRFLFEEKDIDVSSQYINQRLVRLAEHGHVRNVRDSGVYELVDDPRNG